MTDQELLDLARAEGFLPALTVPNRIPIDKKFRKFCEENLCGQYHANYSCPPDCGTVEELQQKLLQEEQVLILQTIQDIDGYENKPLIQQAKKTHNSMVLRLKAKLEQEGYDGFCSGYNICMESGTLISVWNDRFSQKIKQNAAAFMLGKVERCSE